MGDIIFASVEDAIKELKLDRRHKWFEWSGEVVSNQVCYPPCSDCHGEGCSECGYHGKRRLDVPVPAFDKSGNIAKVLKQ